VVWPDTDFPADPYPGAVPPGSFAHVDGMAHEVGAGGRVAGLPLDDWLAGRGAPPIAARVPVLAYGSNRNPSKITWLRRRVGLGDDPVVALRVRTRGVAAVWAAGLRFRDGQRPAVLAAAPGVEESHLLWLATPAQVEALDRCEGRDDRFRLARLGTGTVELDDDALGRGGLVERPWCYLGHAAIRRPLLVDGAPVRCADVPQEVAVGLDGEAGPGDGLDAGTVVGAPHPDEWPAALFAYGLLQPGQSGWPMVAPHAAGTPWRARLPGQVRDTGRGWPAWLPELPGSAPGTVVPLRDPAALLPVLDEYEGPDYRRVRVVVPADGTICWAYAWRSPVEGFAPLPDGWPLR
jgi:gamma-glutamylcyclotransferase (GGCT)/AIG2-like uncharacterized protein YtfP